MYKENYVYQVNFTLSTVLSEGKRTFQKQAFNIDTQTICFFLVVYLITAIISHTLYLFETGAHVQKIW